VWALAWVLLATRCNTTFQAALLAAADGVGIAGQRRGLGRCATLCFGTGFFSHQLLHLKLVNPQLGHNREHGWQLQVGSVGFSWQLRPSLGTMESTQPGICRALCGCPLMNGCGAYRTKSTTSWLRQKTQQPQRASRKPWTCNAVRRPTWQFWVQLSPWIKPFIGMPKGIFIRHACHTGGYIILLNAVLYPTRGGVDL